MIVPTLLIAIAGPAAATAEKAGDSYTITSETRTSTRTGDQSTSTSFDRNAISERVVAVRADGVELQYDANDGSSDANGPNDWRFPARIFRPASGKPQLLNRAELEARRDRWLAQAKLPRTMCGHWYFTWNAFKIECDPQSALEVIAAFDLRSVELRNGAPYRDAGASDAAPLRKTASASGGAVYTVALLPDAAKVRRDRAQSDVVLGEVSRKPVTLETALRAHAADQVTGSITIAFETDAAGVTVARTKTVKLRIKPSTGAAEESETIETLRRDRATAPPRRVDDTTI